MTNTFQEGLSSGLSSFLAVNEEVKKGTKRKIAGTSVSRFHCDDVNRVTDALNASKTRYDLCHVWFTILKVMIIIFCFCLFFVLFFVSLF